MRTQKGWTARHSVIALLLTEGVPVIKVVSLAEHDVDTTNTKYAQKTRIAKAVDLHGANIGATDL